MNHRTNVLNLIFDYIEKFYYFFLAIIIFTASFNVFYNLGEFPLYSWDEARHGISAYEMLKNREFIVNTYIYENDYWNLKPPLSFWAIIFGYNIAGFNALGLRIFSAVAALITILSAAFFTRFKHGKLASLICAAVLTTTTQYILYHCARTGDADSLHVMFFTLAIISAALIGQSLRWLYFAGLFFSLSFLTKSWHALNIAAIIGIYLLISRALFKIKLKQWALFLLASSGPTLAWGLLRYSKDGLDFFKMMVSFDLMARTSTTLEGHIGGPPYYLLTLEESWPFWGMLLIAGLVILLFSYREIISKDTREYIYLLALWISVPLVAYSIARTKITWYIFPVFPPLSILTGAVLSKVLRSLNLWPAVKIVLTLCIAISLFFNQRFIFRSIREAPVDPMHGLLQQISHLKQSGYVNLYTLCGPEAYPEYWLQSDILTMELYNGLTPRNGGLKFFAEDQEKSLIIVPEEDDILKYNKSYQKIFEYTPFTIWAKTGN